MLLGVQARGTGETDHLAIDRLPTDVEAVIKDLNHSGRGEREFALLLLVKNLIYYLYKIGELKQTDLGEKNIAR